MLPLHRCLKTIRTGDMFNIILQPLKEGNGTHFVNYEPQVFLRSVQTLEQSQLPQLYIQPDWNH